MPKHAHHARARERQKVRFVDGFAIRNLYPDFDIIEEFSRSLHREKYALRPYVPPNEVWIDRRFKNEASFLRAVLGAQNERQNMNGRQLRAWLGEHMTKKGPVPPFVVRSEKRGRLVVRYVRGEIVRRHIDPWFVFGGHDLVYDYVPANEVWIDMRQDPNEIPLTLLHEFHERNAMSHGVDYHAAHARATEAELAVRTKARMRRAGRPLIMTPFRQRPGYCAPASIKIVCSYFGREYDERMLGELCGTTSDDGTNHADLIRAGETLGADLLARADGTIADLRRLVLKERLPVIVGWYSPSNPRKSTFVPGKDPVEDHFSVIYHVTKTHVFMMDPECAKGRRKMRISRFLKLWWDTDTPKNVRVNRWYMAMRFDGKKF